ncbi:heme lyase NrfEFG subunit NrfF [Vibrio mexicanus]|uniref:heme lyase NrfEFG subunit NrfF n=1 Tax=Vibrio mexicanus TaxID=1004326 RepID=UPI000A8F0451|nr:heme lyase NrfEFG subunit NrfF [Vibrio mexicanus]
MIRFPPAFIRGFIALIIGVLSVFSSPSTFANEALFAPADKQVIEQVELFEFSSPEKQKRAIALAKALRCPQCQNQNLVESNSPIAKDLRLIVFQMIESGDSEQQVVDYMTARYGDFVRYKPALSLQNSLLWGLPVLLLIGFVGLSFYKVSRRSSSN